MIKVYRISTHSQIAETKIVVASVRLCAVIHKLLLVTEGKNLCDRRA